MRVNMGGHAENGKKVHAVMGEWSYTSDNSAWCGVALTGNDHMMIGYVEVTCKRCQKVTPTYSQELRDAAWEYITRWRAGFDASLERAFLSRAFPGSKLTYLELSQIILSGAKVHD